MLKDNPDWSWEQIAKRDAYFGVLSQERYRSDKIDPSLKQEFFESGGEYVDHVIARIEQCFGKIARRSALDFGCGVGRLVIPLARQFQHVVGVDVSSTMIEEARNNCERYGVGNVEFVLSKDGLASKRRRFDFVNSYIVLQHVPKSRGFRIIEQLIGAVDKGGAGAIHFIFHREISPVIKLVAALRKRFKPLHYAINLLTRQRWNYPLLQMNHQKLNEVLPLFWRHGIKTLVFEMTKHTSHYGAIVMFRK